MAARTKARKKTLRRRRSDEEKAGGRWRMTISEVVMSRRGYSWTTYLVQGWKDERGKWGRRKFQDRASAEAFVAAKQMENVTTGAALRPVLTTLSPEQVKEAEVAFAKLAEIGAAVELASGEKPCLIDAVARYGVHVRGTMAVDRVPLRDARGQCLQDKERSGMRLRSREELEISLRAFERWLLMLPRFTAETIDPNWTPAVCEITREDVTGYLDSLRSRAGLKASGKSRNNARGDLHAFFDWCRGRHKGRSMPGVSRRWCAENPVTEIPKVEARPPVPCVLSVEEAAALMRHVEAYQAGRLAPFYALALFAGLRPGRGGELHKLAAHPHLSVSCREAGGRPLIDLERGVITVTADVSKTGRKRVVTIQPNLRQWLVRYGVSNLLPHGSETAIRSIRKACNLGHDVCRHSFISFHIAAFGSKARAALEAGNSEAIIDAHYLNLPTQKEGEAFFGILPAESDSQLV